MTEPENSSHDENMKIKVAEKEQDECLRNRLSRAEKKLDKLERYNEELRGQLRLSNEKFLLTKTFLYETVSTQTELSYLCQPQISPTDSHGPKFGDYCYDAKTNTYFSRSSGLYFYPESQTYYNPSDQKYYKYNDSTKKYEFWCNLETSHNEKHDSKQTSKPLVVDEIEEGEIEDIQQNENENLIDENTKTHESVTTAKKVSHQKTQPAQLINCPTSGSKIIECKPMLREEMDFSREEDLSNSFYSTAPCRLIVKQSDSLESGSLLLISCMGGKIGQHSNCTVTIPDKTISQIHAEINYDLSRKIYTIQDLLSRNGTFLNGKKLVPLERNPLFHGDEISLSDCCHLIAHIHQFRDFNCAQCEPQTIVKNQDSIYSNSVNKNAKSRMKSLKRKYGLEGASSSTDFGLENAQLPNGYKDRAAERQKTVGSDCPYEKTAAGSTLDTPLNEKNKGFQLLQRMGWKNGQKLGKDSESGLLEPIELADVGQQRHGLGFKS